MSLDQAVQLQVVATVPILDGSEFCGTLPIGTIPGPCLLPSVALAINVGAGTSLFALNVAQASVLGLEQLKVDGDVLVGHTVMLCISGPIC